VLTGLFSVQYSLVACQISGAEGSDVLIVENAQSYTIIVITQNLFA